jgi:hypothetical protein
MHLDTSCEYYTQSSVQSNCTPNQCFLVEFATNILMLPWSLDEYQFMLS